MTLTPVDTPDGLRWHKIADGVEMQVVDDHDHPLSTGQVGRVRVKSLGAATSYLDDEAATAAFFRDGYFYPGDLALWREDGRRHSRERQPASVLPVARSRLLDSR